MAIKLVVDSDAVFTRMSLDSSIQEIVTAVESGLVAAHVFFQGLLDTPFEPVTSQVEVFWPTTSMFPVLPNNMFQLRLKRGFIKVASVSLKYAEERDAEAADWETVPTADWIAQAEKGIVLLESEDYDGKYVQVTYDAGFSTDNKAPDWLKEAILTYMPAVLHFQQTDPKANEHRQVADQIRKLASTMVERHLRTGSFLLHPIS